MTLGAVNNPFEPIVGLDGIGLNEGALYIGTPGLDPETNPQACYWDAEGTIPATQPISIVGGYPMRTGTPTRVYTATGYSMRVRDRQGQQVFYVTNAVPAATTADGLFDTMAAAVAAVIPPAVQATGLQLRGYYSVLDGGGGYYKYSAAMPSYLGRFQSADGAWWELVADVVKPQQFGAVGDGAADDTVAFQKALSSGRPVFAPGVFKTSATLNINTIAQIGLQLAGEGSAGNAGDGSNKTIIRPTSAVTVALKIDGTALGSFIQNVSVSALCIDMANMTDASTSVGIQLTRAFNNEITGVVAINPGTAKRGFKATTGAYTTVIKDCRFRIMEMIGTSFADAVTTLTFLNCDFSQVAMTFVNHIQFLGGACQGTLDRFLMTSVSGVRIQMDVEGSGTYLNFLDNACSSIFTGCDLSGHTGAYMTAQGPVGSYYLQDGRGGSNISRQTSSSFRYTGGTSGSDISSFLQSGAVDKFYALFIGRTISDSVIAMCGGANQFVNGSAAGDLVITTNGATSTFIGAAGETQIHLYPTGFMTMPDVLAKGSFADDVAAAAGGVPLAGVYRTGNAMKIRIA